MPSLGAFLRTKREQLRPEAPNGRHLARRRTPGLRREEVAERAGLSVDWYTRLEQDRATSPSVAVLEAVSTALQLNEGERKYLYRLARDSEPPPQRLSTQVHPALAAALAAITEQPAIVFNPRHDILATNPLGEALFLGFNREGRFARNGPWFVFCDERALDLYPEYRRVARETVGSLRGAFARHPHDPTFLDLIAELTRCSSLFSELWRAQHVSDKTGTRKRFSHPYAGELELEMHSLTAIESPEQRMVLYVPRDERTRQNLTGLVPTGRMPASKTLRKH